MSETVQSGPGGGPPDVAGAPTASAESQSRDAASTAKRVVIPALAALLVVWIGIKAADDFSQFVTVTLNGLSLSALYFVVASGFTLIFGLMRVVNMAHGSLYLLGGYIALKMQEGWFKQTSGGDSLGLSLNPEGDATYSLLGWIIPLILATAIIGVI